METTQKFIEALEEAGVEVRTDYSGRGMNGKSCIGALVGTEAQARSLIIELLTGAADSDRDSLGRILRRGKLDNLGKDLIFYFPGISTEEEGSC